MFKTSFWSKVCGLFLDGLTRTIHRPVRREDCQPLGAVDRHLVVDVHVTIADHADVFSDELRRRKLQVEGKLSIAADQVWIGRVTQLVAQAELAGGNLP